MITQSIDHLLEHGATDIRITETGKAAETISMRWSRSASPCMASTLKAMPDIAADLAGTDAPIAATRIGNSVGAGASDGAGLGVI